MLNKGVLFKKMSHILINNKAKIKIEKNTFINSSNYQYHINMYSRVKLYANMPNTEIIIGNNCRIHGTCINASNKIIA